MSNINKYSNNNPVEIKHPYKEIPNLTYFRVLPIVFLLIIFY